MKEFKTETRADKVGLTIEEKNNSNRHNCKTWVDFDEKQGTLLVTTEVNQKTTMIEIDTCTGNLVNTLQSRDGLFHGQNVDYNWETGKIDKVFHYRSEGEDIEEITGPKFSFDGETGNLVTKGFRLNSKPHGLQEKYDSSGYLEEAAIYDNGVLVKDFSTSMRWIQFFDTAKALIGINRRDRVTLLRDQEMQLKKNISSFEF